MRHAGSCIGNTFLPAHHRSHPKPCVMHLNSAMSKENREHKTEDSDPRRQEEKSKYGDHPLLGSDRQPIAKEVLRFPERPAVDPMTRLPSDPERDYWRNEFETEHDPSVEYQPPNPMLVVPPANATAKLMGVIAALLLFAIIIGLMFYRWMTPAPRYPDEHRPSPGLVQTIP